MLRRLSKVWLDNELLMIPSRRDCCTMLYLYRMNEDEGKNDLNTDFDLVIDVIYTYPYTDMGEAAKKVRHIW